MLVQDGLDLDERGIYTLQFYYDTNSGVGCELTVTVGNSEVLYTRLRATTGYAPVTIQTIRPYSSGGQLQFEWKCPSADVFSRFDDILLARTGTIPEDD